MKVFAFLFFSLMPFIVVSGQSYGFDDGEIAPFQLTVPSKGQLALVNSPYKNGNASLKWTWTAPSELVVENHITLRNFRDGVIFWVYNEIPSLQSLKGEFRDATGNVQYYFEFGLDYSGWRICRIGSRYMSGNKSNSANLKLFLISPQGHQQGTLFIDRFSFAADVGYQNAPDKQQPSNNEARYVNHWNSLWMWESELQHSYPIPASLNASQVGDLAKVASAIDRQLPSAAVTSLVNNAKSLFEASNIRFENGFWVGAPLVVKPDVASGDISFAELGTMMMGLAQDAVYNHNATSASNYLSLWDYARNQGFDYGSAMGNNHHYGYDTRQIFTAAFLMREHLHNAGKLIDVARALTFWSGLAEARQPFNVTRDGVVDTWNTLLFPRLISAMLMTNLPERYQAVHSLIKWLDTALEYTPGNMGGIKPDGAVFHHAGHYPAYAVGGFGGIGKVLATLANTGFEISHPSRLRLANALMAMSQYTHFRDWSIGMSGRHPHQGAMTDEVVEAFAYLALLGGVYDMNESIDSKLVREYLRLETENTTLKQELSSFTTGVSPQGFFVMNHAAAGVHRFATSMVTIKGYNSDVWGSEIYTNDNRYGRYQSYGAIEIFNEGLPVTRANSRFSQDGWDWNRLPGTTTIHLPLQLLESPVSSTLMARSRENFAGASSLNNQFGVFGMKLWEQNLINNTNYTPDFKARKSVFVFGKRMVSIGTDISNSNSGFPTETTLFQQSIFSADDRFGINGEFFSARNYRHDTEVSQLPTLISDLSGNYYRVKEGNRLVVEGKLQTSRHNKTRAETTGEFFSARIQHGKAPVNESYEYMIMLKPTPPEQRRWNIDPGYRVWQANHQAHIVHDTISNVTAYVAFESVQPETGLIRMISSESLVMIQPTQNGLMMSVCDPSLRLPVKTNNSDNTAVPGVTTIREVIIDGHWQLATAMPEVETTVLNNQTLLKVSCSLGIPVEFTLTNITSSDKKVNDGEVTLRVENRKVIVEGYTNLVAVYSVAGQLLKSQHGFTASKEFWLRDHQMYLLVAHLPENRLWTRKLIF